MPDEGLTADESQARAASVELLDLIDRLDRWGLLEGAVQANIARSLEVFRLRAAVDPARAWDPGLREHYKALHRHAPTPPGGRSS